MRRAQFYLKMAKALTLFWGDLSFQFQCPQWTGDNFPATSFYPRIICVFPSLVCESFLKKCWRAQFYLKMAKALTLSLEWFILSISMPRMDRVDVPATSVYPWIKCVFLLQSVRISSKNADVDNFISKWWRLWPFLWGDLSFQCQCPQWTAVDFPATSFYPWIKCVFLLQSVRISSKNADVDNFISKWGRPWPDFLDDLSFQFHRPQWTGVDFQDTSFCPRICVFLLQAVRVSSKNADVHNIISKWRRPWPFLRCDLSSQFQRPQWTGVDFQDTSFYSRIKCVFLLPSVRVFSNNADVHNFISNWRRPWSFIWGDLPFQFECPQWTGDDFPATSFYPRIKCVFPTLVCESFLKKGWRSQFYHKMVKNWPDFFRDLSFQFQRPQWTGVDFPGTSFYPWIKCLFLLQAVRVFSKNADVHNIISKWRRPWPFLWCDLSFQFQRPQWTGLDFSATSFYLTIKCVFPSSVCENFLKKCDVHNFISKWRRPWPFFGVIYPFNFNAHNGPGTIFQPLPFIRG